MIGCRHCGADRPPVVDLSPEGKRWKCMSCGAVDVTDPNVEQDQPAVAANPKTAKPEAKSPEKPARAHIPDPNRVVKDARRDLKRLTRDIKATERHLAKMKNAADKLQKLLDAADGQSLAVVRPLRQSRN